MPSIYIESNTNEAAQALARLGVEIPAIGQRGVYPIARRIVDRMKKPGLPIEYPVSWDSERQRRAFFATDGFGRGIPTGRSGLYEDAWQMAKLPSGYVVTNDSTPAIYVGGDEYGQGQSMIHQGRWPLFANIADDELQNLNAEVLSELQDTARKDGLEMT